MGLGGGLEVRGFGFAGLGRRDSGLGYRLGV